MSLESPHSANPEQATLWDTQSLLVGQFRAMQTSGASPEEIDAVADAINSNVAELVELGELEPEAAWACSAGDNPYLPEVDQSF